MEKEEYELCLFGFSVQQISIERIHLLKKIIKNISESVLQKFSKVEGVAELLAETNTDITGNVLDAFKEHLEKLDNLDMKYFAIPANVLLPTDFNLTKNCTDEDEVQQKLQLEHLKREFMENSVYLVLLDLECNRYKVLENIVSEESEIQQHLQQLTNAFDMQNLIALVNITESITSLNT